MLQLKLSRQVESGTAWTTAVVSEDKRIQPGVQITLRTSEGPTKLWTVAEMFHIPFAMVGWDNNI